MNLKSWFIIENTFMRLIIFKQQCVSIQNAKIYGLVIFVADKKWKQHHAILIQIQLVTPDFLYIYIRQRQQANKQRQLDY